jgi:Oxidoreductase family, NAD-binding Rossmann fold
MTGTAIVGTGMWAPRLADAAERSELELVTCSRHEQKRGELAQRFGCESAPNFEEAIGHPGVDGVLLVTPNDLHGEQAIACAERGRHVRLLGTDAVLEYRTDFSVWPDARALDGVKTLTLAGEPETGADDGIAALAAVLGALEAHAGAVA